jgi:RNA polymerase sigma-70 factor (ECF subfamily)
MANSDNEPSGSHEQEWATLDEVCDAISNLSDADFLRLEGIADAFVQSHPLLEGMDLVQEAFRRLLEPEAEGKRKRHWSRGTSFVTTVIGTMRSLADEYRRQHSTKKSMEAGTVDDLGVGSGGPDTIDTALFAERRVEQIYQLFHDDEEIEEVLLRLHDEMTAEEIRDELGITATEYATARRRLRRGLDKKFPKGWRDDDKN